jgi:hypothetical protein
VLTRDEIAAMRATSTSALPDTCTITRPVEEFTLNETTLVSEPGDTETVYAGPCRVRPRESQELDTQVGDLHETLSPYIATLPATAAGALARDPDSEGDPVAVIVDDFLTVTVSTDDEMVGRSFQVTTVSRGSWKLDRRLGVEDREQPQGIEVGS